MCGREVVIIQIHDTIRVAAKLMRSHHVGDVVAVEIQKGENIPVGILTDRDIVLGLIATDVAISLQMYNPSLYPARSRQIE